MHQRGESRRSDQGAKFRAALVYGCTAALALLAPSAQRRVARRLPAGVADLVVLSTSAAVGWTTIGVLERIRPYRTTWNEPQGDVQTDIADMVVSDSAALVAVGLISLPIRSLRGSSGGPLKRLPLAARLAILVLAWDLGHYTLHRVLHEKGDLWRFHAPHHSPERLYWGNAARFHPVELVVDGTQEQTLLALLQVDPSTKLAYQVFRGIYGQIQHANIDLDSGPLNRWFSTPERHRWHHSDNPVEGNTNYGAVVAVWDRVFGSSFTPDGDFTGVVGNGDTHYPRDWVGQLRAPFGPPTPSPTAAATIATA